MTNSKTQDSLSVVHIPQDGQINAITIIKMFVGSPKKVEIFQIPPTTVSQEVLEQLSGQELVDLPSTLPLYTISLYNTLAGAGEGRRRVGWGIGGEGG